MAGLNELGLAGGDMAGILITHEHSDHIRGAWGDFQKVSSAHFTVRERLWRESPPAAAWEILTDSF